MNYFIIPGVQSTLLNVLFNEFQITYSQFTSHRRKTEVVCARYCFYYFIHKKKGIPYPRLEKKTGVDHSSILHGVNKVTSIIDGEYHWAVWGDKIKNIVKQMDDLTLNDNELYEFHKARTRIHQAS